MKTIAQLCTLKVMVAFLASLFVLLSISGCTKTKYVEVPVPYEVRVPVKVPCPVPEKHELPALPIDQLKLGDGKDPKKVSDAYVNSIDILEKHIKIQDIQLDVYRKTDGN